MTAMLAAALANPVGRRLAPRRRVVEAAGYDAPPQSAEWAQIRAKRLNHSAAGGKPPPYSVMRPLVGMYHCFTPHIP